MWKTFSFASLLVLSLSSAHADDGASPSAPREDRRVSITVSPVHLAIPMAEVTTEIRVADKIGVAAVLGIGAFRDPSTNMRVSLYEGGLSARYYVTGSFGTGLQLGAEALYVHAATDVENIDVKAAGLGLAPFAGYKWTHGSGFTLEGQLGATFMVAKAKAETGQMAETSKVGPMLNLNLGYSF